MIAILSKQRKAVRCCTTKLVISRYNSRKHILNLELIFKKFWFCQHQRQEFCFNPFRTQIFFTTNIPQSRQFLSSPIKSVLIFLTIPSKGRPECCLLFHCHHLPNTVSSFFKLFQVPITIVSAQTLCGTENKLSPHAVHSKRSSHHKKKPSKTQDLDY